MEKRISVIIPYSNNKTYLIRCLNSIKRQYYEKFDIILITDRDFSSVNLLEKNNECKNFEQELKKKYPITIIYSDEKQKYSDINSAIRLAEGDYIFFCSIFSVLAPNTFSNLVTKIEQDDTIFPNGQIYIPSLKGYKTYHNMGMTIWGKLFLKDIIVNNDIFIKQEYTLAEYLFIVEYFGYISDSYLDSDIYIYQESVENLQVDLDKQIDIEEWNVIFTTLKEVISKTKTSQYLVSCLEKYISKNHIASIELMKLAEMKLHGEYKINYLFAKQILPLLWEEIINFQNIHIFAVFTDYLKKYENESNFLELLLHICNLEICQYKFLKADKLEDALFFINAFSEGKANERYDRREMSLQLEKIETSVQVIEKELGLEYRSGRRQKILLGLQDGLIQLGKKWFYYKKGEIDRTFCGLCQNEYGWWYVENGTIDFSHFGIENNAYGSWCVVNGKVDTSVNGYISLGKIAGFFDAGKLNTNIVGLHKIEDKWVFFNQGIRDNNFVGLVKNEYGWWYVEEGEINYRFKGLVKNEYGWWYVNNGTIDYQYKGLAKNEYGWWYIENGTIKKSEEQSSNNDLNKKKI